MRLTRHLPGFLQGCRGTRMGNHAQQVCRTAQSGQVKETWRNQEGQGALISNRGKEKGVVFYGLGSVQKIPTRSRVILDFWAIHLKSTTAALVDALKTCRVKLLAVPAISNERCVFSGVTRECFFLASDCGCTRCRTVSWGAKVGERWAETTCVLAVVVFLV